MSAAAPPRPRPHLDVQVDLALVTVFAVVVGFVILRHEMWRDETQAWLIAKASTTPHELIHHTRYEGHPFLWYALLWPFAHLSHAPRVEQLVEWALAVAATALVVLRAPFSRVQKALYVFGYFAAFEYGVLARSYTLGVLLVFGAVAAATSPRHRSWWIVGPLLVGTAFTSVFGAIVAAAVLVGLLVDSAHRREPRRNIAVATVVGVAVLVIAYAQARPAPRTGALAGWHTGLDAHRAAGALAAVSRALVPVPKLQHAFWNTSITDGHSAIGALLGVALAAGVAWALRGARGPLSAWCVGVVGLVAFSYVKLDELSTMRYVGHVFVLLVVVVWLAGGVPSPRLAASLTALLALQAAVGVYALARDTTDTWSDARATATFLRAHSRRGAVIVAEPDFAGAAVSAYLDRPLHYVNGDRDGTFVLWDRRRLDVHGRLPAHALLVVDAPRPGAGRLVARFTDGIVTDEHFWIYQLP